MAVKPQGLGLANESTTPAKKKKREYSQKYVPHIGFSQFHQDRYSQHMSRDGYMGAYYHPENKPSVPPERKWTGSKW